MTAETSLAHQAIRLMNYVEDVLSPDAEAPGDDVLMALYNLHTLSPSYAVITCPARHPEFFYISENCQSIFGYSAEYFAENFKSLSQYYAQLHPADVNDIQACMSYFGSFMQAQAQEDYHKLRAVFHYRFRHPTGKYIYLQDDKACLVTASGKTIYYSLVRIAGDESLFTGARIEIYKQESGLQKLAEYRQSAAGNKLSARETDLVQLIKKGLTTKEIAWQLNISHNTVRNIKSKLFEKYKVNNAIELLNVAG